MRSAFYRAASSVLAAAMLMTSMPARSETMYAMCRSHINVRAWASKKSTIEGRLHCGDAIETEKTVRRGGLRWFYCTDLPCEISNGYVCADYFCDSPVTECDSYATITASGRVAVRKSINGKRIRWAKPGARIHVLAYCDDWILSTRGYIRREFVLLDEEQTEAQTISEGQETTP